MVKVGVTIGAIMLVITFMLGVLGAFPLSSGANGAIQYTSVTDEEESLDVDAVEEVGDLLLLSYTDLIDDISSFQHDPSIERAESRKNAFRDYADDLVTRFQDFASTLRVKLDELTAEAQEESSQ